jgi:hypothetical protein
MGGGQEDAGLDLQQLPSLGVEGSTYDIADSLERNWNDLATFADEQSKRVDADVATLGSQLPKQHSECMTTP